MELTPDVLQNAASGGLAVGGAWALREVIRFLKWWKTKDIEAQYKTYKPSLEWEEYCRDSFDDIRDTVHRIDRTSENHEVRISHLEQSKKKGGPNGRHQGNF